MKDTLKLGHFHLRRWERVPVAWPVVILVAGLLRAGEDPAVEARRFFELGDYPGCERALKEILAAGNEIPAPERARILARLAEVYALQGADREALLSVDEALKLDPAPAVRRGAVAVYLRTQRFHEALPHIEALLSREPGDPSLVFSRGLARARTGDFEAAVADLSRSLEAPGLWRDARFELALAHAKLHRPERALVHLREILEKDPCDPEAVYQASRQLLALKAPEARRTAAQLSRYFEAIRALEGESSREHHLRAAGKREEAAIEEAKRWERLGAYDRVLAALGAAGENRMPAPEIALHLAGFWLRQGLLEEAMRVLERGEVGGEPQAKVRGAAAREREKLAAAKLSAIADARRLLAEVQWSEAAPVLNDLLDAARREGDGAAAQQAARLLLARDESSRAGLEYLIARAGDPSLLVPRLHYVSRLARSSSAPPGIEAQLETLRRRLEGE